MNTPRLKVYFENGALGQVQPSADGVFGILCTAATVAGTFALQTPYVLRKLEDLDVLGITLANNPGLLKVVTDFYAEAPAGTEVWIMGFADTVAMSAMVDVTDLTKGRALILAANGRLRGLFVSRTPDVGYTPTITNGLDADVILARANAQALAVWATDSKAAPLFVVISGTHYSGNAVDLTDLTLETKNRVAVMIGDRIAGTRAAVGLLAGRLARIPIQRNIARVSDGTLATVTAFIGAKTVEQAEWESIHAKGYITFRTLVGRAGYFFVDDALATLPTDDYNHLTARRTIDKAYRIAYATVLEKLLSEVPVNTAGTVPPAVAKSWEADVENAIATAMTVPGELSADPTNASDKGVKCFIDPNQPLASTGSLDIQVRVRPYGYARFLNIYLGFQVVAQ